MSEEQRIQESEELSMEDFAEELEKTFQKVYTGDIVKAKILELNADEAIVDMDSYMDGILPVADSVYEGEVLDELYHVGDELTLMVTRVDSAEGQIFLSKKEADKIIIWDELQEKKDREEPISVKVKGVVKGGLRIGYKGVEGFMPASQVSISYVENLEDYLNMVLDAEVMDLDAQERNLVVTRKAIEKKQAEQAKKDVYATLEKGTTLTGKVVRLANFGAFVEIAPHVDGLVHVTDMSWKRVKHPSDIVHEGDIVQVHVLDVDPVRERISLSLKDVAGDPWNAISFREGEVLTGKKVVKIIGSGAFVEVADGLEGFVHISQIAPKRINTVSEALSEGEEVNVKVLKIDPEQKRISLSIKEAAQDAIIQEEEENIKSYTQDSDAIGVSLKEAFKGIHLD